VTGSVLLRGGQVVDGTGSPARRADVLVVDGRIEAVEVLPTVAGARELDVSGLVVVPGLIDVHTHTDLVPFYGEDERLADLASASVRQGVTTEVAGNCGSSPWPAPGDDVEDSWLEAMPERARRAFPSLAAYREAARAAGGMRVNVAPLVGHGSVRTAVMGGTRTAPTDQQLRAMLRLVEASLDEGAFGLSSGLVYAPGVYAAPDELAALAAPCGRRGRVYASHLRDEGDAVVAAVSEALDVGRATGAAVQLSHHKVMGRHNWGLSQVTLARVDEARAQGVGVHLDAYPYTSGSTALSALLPAWALEGDATTVRRRLRHDRARIRDSFAEGGWQNFPRLGGWDGIRVVGESPLSGSSLLELSEGDPVDALCEALLVDLALLCTIEAMSSDEVEAILDHEACFLGSDGIPATGPQHPRLGGAFARALGRVRHDDQRFVDLVRRCTSEPARAFGLTGRGQAVVGCVADLAVLAVDELADTSTVDRPVSRPMGVRHVLVSGTAVVQDGELTTARPGSLLEAAG
jgi:N-acyl-D-aspartate/D-glutamate deacylase